MNNDITELIINLINDRNIDYLRAIFEPLDEYYLFPEFTNMIYGYYKTDPDIVLNVFGFTPLIASSYLDAPELVNYFLSLGADINHQTDNGETALLIAVRTNNYEMAKLLVQHGADVNLTNRMGASVRDYIDIFISMNDPLYNSYHDLLEFEV